MPVKLHQFSFVYFFNYFQAILQQSVVSVEIEVKPRLLVPDTNCFIDYLTSLKTITEAQINAQPVYILSVPLVGKLFFYR